MLVHMYIMYDAVDAVTNYVVNAAIYDAVDAVTNYVVNAAILYMMLWMLLKNG